MPCAVSQHIFGSVCSERPAPRPGLTESSARVDTYPAVRAPPSASACRQPWCVSPALAGERFLVVSAVVAFGLRSYACVVRPWLRDTRREPLRACLPGADGSAGEGWRGARLPGTAPPSPADLERVQVLAAARLFPLGLSRPRCCREPGGRSQRPGIRWSSRRVRDRRMG